ncbi:MAG: LysR family transcriptional regulator [Geobacter sp.]|nr:MAG: LysR family transcriptional regulator [Geobacter sp.]
MDIRQVRVFVEIVRQGSFTKAAEQLHVAQPAVSMTVRGLEEELELTLFNRRDRKISLTAEGEVFLRHAEGILAGLKAAELEMAEIRGLIKGEVRVGIPPMMSTYFFPDIIYEFKRRYPQLNLSVNGEGAWRIQQMISRGEIDMGVITGKEIPDDLETRHFRREEVVVCVSREHRFAKRKSVTLEEFAGEPLIFFKEGYYLRELIGEVLKGTGQSPHVVFETNMFSLVKSLVQRGMGISTLLRMVVAGDEALSAVSLDPPLHIDLVIAWEKHAYLSRANRAFVDFLLERTKGYENRR